MNRQPSLRRTHARPPLVLPLALTAAFLVVPQRAAAQAPRPADAAAPVATSSLTLSLAECLEMAAQQQPRLAAARASLAAAEDGRRALDALHIPGLLAPELPIRRCQAALGVTAAAAGVEHAEREEVYAVSRTYITVLYARQQERIARSVVERLTATYDVARQGLEAGAKGVTDTDVKRATVYLRLAKAKQIEAAQGVKRALVALREAIGLCPDVTLNVPAAPLPEPGVRPSRDEIVAAALARRPGLIQTTVLAEVTGLEVEAQATGAHKKMETFAAGSDVHARAIPQAIRNTEYRPGSVPPEMPTMLAGARAERVKHAQALHARAVAVAETTRNLIALEVEDAFLRWQEAAAKAQEARVAAETGEQLARDLSKDFTAGLRVAVQDVVNAHVLGSQARAQYNEYRYHALLVLIDLERATAGGFCARLVEALAP